MRTWLEDTAGDRMVRLVIGPIRIAVRSELVDVVDHLRELYPPGATGEGPEAFHLEVRRAGRTRTLRPLYQVTADGQEVGGLQRANGVFPMLEWAINLRVIARCTEFVQFHAASMVFGGQGFIFPGDSGCGKSTLAAMLLARGWQYFCDEFALVAKDSLLLHPFPKAICLKSGSHALARSLRLRFARRRDYVKAFKGRVGYINPRSVGDGETIPPVPVRYVVFPAYKADAPPTLVPVSRAEAAMQLYRCCFNKNAHPQFALPSISKLVQGASCWRLTVGAPDDTARLLESLCKDQRIAPSGGKKAAFQTLSHPGNRKARLATRREALKMGAKLAYAAPTVWMLTAQQAFAAASNPSGICSTAAHTGQLCETNLDCCSKQCNLGICQ